MRRSVVVQHANKPDLHFFMIVCKYFVPCRLAGLRYCTFEFFVERAGRIEQFISFFIFFVYFRVGVKSVLWLSTSSSILRTRGQILMIP